MKANDVGGLWNALLKQCRSRNVHTLWEIYQKNINVKMNTTDILILYQGSIKEYIIRIDGTDFDVLEAHKWGILNMGLLDLYKLLVRPINISLEELPY